MITPKDNGYGRVKRWREKNRALYNLRQCEYRRRKSLSVPEEAESVRQSPSLGPDEVREGNSPKKAACPNQRDFRGGQTPTIDKLHNFRSRKKNLPVSVLTEPSASCLTSAGPTAGGEARESTPSQPLLKAADFRGGQKIEELRELVRVEQDKPSTKASVNPQVVGGIYRNDLGGVISKFAWEKLQKLKAKEGGYTLDEYSQ